MRKQPLNVLAAMIALLFASPLAFAGDEMMPGMWETKVTTTIEGVPVPPQTVTQSQCLTDKDVKDRKKILPSNPQDSECKIEDFKIAGNKITWRIECAKSKTSGSGEMTVGAESYKGTMKMTTVSPGGPTLKMNMEIAGKRAGACK